MGHPGSSKVRSVVQSGQASNRGPDEVQAWAERTLDAFRAEADR